MRDKSFRHLLVLFLSHLGEESLHGNDGRNSYRWRSHSLSLKVQTVAVLSLTKWVAAPEICHFWK